MFEEIFSSSEEFKNFLSQIRSSKQSHSYLIVSKDNFSAGEMATLFAKALLCNDMCGKCENCKKVALKSHPDVEYFPEGAKLLVDDSKKIVEESFTKPIFADKKIFIISGVDNSTEEAQNKLLKSLEEPNDTVYYILTTSNLEKVLPTIRSRCNKVEMKAVPEEKILSIMTADEKTKDLAVKLGGGYVSKSLELEKKQNLFDVARLAVRLLKDLNSSKDAITYVKEIVDLKGDFQLLLEVLGVIIEDAIMIKTNKKAAIRLEMFRQDVENIANELSLKCLSSLCFVLSKANKDLGYNVSLPLNADNLVMNILEVKYLCK